MSIRWPREIDGVAVPYGRPASELQSLITGGAPERWAAVVALAESTDPTAPSCLADLSSSRDEHVRRFVVQWIGRIARRPELDHVVLGRLLDTSGPVVRTAAQVVWIFGMREARGRVIGLLKAASPATRGEALRTLEKIWHEDDFATVLALFREDSSRQVRRMGGWTLRATRTAARAKDLFELWRSDPLARHRTWACEIVAAASHGLAEQAQAEKPARD
jgi:hypothetical protein